ncbi:MAG: hypothetical protein ACYDEJ_15340 [Desulfitobacteriaceae bacterium]
MGKWVRYPLLSARTITLLSVITIAVVIILVFVFGHKSFLVELERSIGIISVILFLFLSHCLYRGVRLKNEPIVKGKWRFLRGSEYADVLSNIPVTPSFELASEGLGGIVLAIISWIVFTIVALILLFLLANVVWGVIFVLAVVVYWIFYRALRLALVKSRICKGKLMSSLGYGLLFTTMYSGWIYGVLFAFKFWVR